MKRKFNLNFISINAVPKGVKSFGVYDENNRKVGAISLGNLASKSEGDKLYTFGALSDVHLPYDTGLEDFIRALNYFNNVENVDFICISGDMGSTGVADEWVNFKAQVDAHSPNTPVHISAGNHDAGQSASKSYDYPIPYTGNPLYYSFTQGDDVFIMFGMTFWGDPPFSNESLQWLYETLEENRNKRCFVFQHMMRKGYAGDASGRYPWDGLSNTNGQVFLSLMNHYKNVLWFHGHTHCEFEQQDTLLLPNSNYDRLFGCHSIHVPSCCLTRNEDNGYDYEDSEGYVVDVYENGVHLRGRDFVAEKFLPIASYWIDTTLVNIGAKTYIDAYGVIDTGSDTPSDVIIDVMEESEMYLNQRYSKSGGGWVTTNGVLGLLIPFENSSGKPMTLTFDDLAYNMLGNNCLLYILDSDKSNPLTVNGSCDFVSMTSGVEVADDGLSGTVTFTPSINEGYLAICIRSKDDGTEATMDEFENYVITLSITTGNEGEEITDQVTWTADTRMSASSGNYSTLEGIYASNDIPVEQGDIIRIYGATTWSNYPYVNGYSASEYLINIDMTNKTAAANEYYTVTIDENMVMKITIIHSDVSYIRVCGNGLGNDSVRVSRNLELS